MNIRFAVTLAGAFCIVAPFSPAQDAAVETHPSQEESESMPQDDPLDFLIPGETLVFELSYGIFGTSGETRIQTYDKETEEGPRRIVKQTTVSRGAVELFYPLRSDAESTLDLETGRTLLNVTKGKEGSKESGTTTVFDYEAGMIIHTDHYRERRNGTNDIPEGNVYDIMISMMKARTLNLEPGTVRNFTAVFEDDIYEMEATVLRKKKIKVPAGTYEAVEVQLKQLGELKGFFKKGGTMKFWLSTGENPQIVQIDLDTKIGTIRSKLASVEVSEDE